LEQLVSRSTSAAGGPAGTVHYIHDLDGHIIAEADASTGATVREYIWMAANSNEPEPATGLDPVDLPLAVVDDIATTPVLLVVHTDHLGRPIRMTDATKVTVWQASYKPWGEPLSISGTRALNLRFPGQYFQIETTLAYNWHRHYDMVTGRYTQPDPLGFVDGPSIYAYAGNNPWVRTDPKGLMILFGAAAGDGAAGNGTEAGAGQEPCDQGSHQPLLQLVGKKSPVIRCVNCNAPTGTTFAPYCPDCYIKSQDPNGGVPPLAGPWVVPPANED
jgi:RHS repeat-associated protein